MMTFQEAMILLGTMEEKRWHSKVYIGIPVPEGPGPEEVEAFLKDIRKLGYSAYVHVSAHGEEIVITDKWVGDGDAGPPRCPS